MTITSTSVQFSKQCYEKMDYQDRIEVLIHPKQKILVVRISIPENKTSIIWSKGKGEKYCKAKAVTGTAFLPVIFSLCGWKYGCKYKIVGIRRSVEGKPILVFDLNDVTTFLPNKDDNVQKLHSPDINIETDEAMISSRRYIGAFPQHWSDNFGKLYYRHAQASELVYFKENGYWPMEETLYDTTNLSPSSEKELSRNIAELLQDMTANGGNNGAEPV